MIDAWNIKKIESNNLSIVLDNADIIKMPCLVVVGELVGNVLAGMK